MKIDFIKMKKIKETDESDDSSLFYQNSVHTIYSRKLQVEGIQFKIRDLILWTNTGVCLECAPQFKVKQAFIKGINLQFNRKQLVGIIGAKDEGRYLLQFLSGRDPEKKLNSSYRFTINDIEFQELYQVSDLFGFVEKQNLAQSDASPFQIFQYYAKIKGEKGTKYLAYELIDILGIQSSAHEHLGSSNDVIKVDLLTRKKVNIGIELIKKPEILFVENPMQGLQISEALNLIKILERIRNLGVTVVVSLYEPRWQIVSQFTNLIFINEGYVSFEGRPCQLKQRLHQMNIKFLQMTNINYFKIQQEKSNSIKDPDIEYINFISKLIKLQNKNYRQLESQITETTLSSKAQLLIKINQKRKSPIMLIKQIYTYTKFNHFKLNFHLYFKIFLLIFYGLLLLLNIRIGKLKDNPVRRIQNLKGFYFYYMLFHYIFGAISFSRLFNSNICQYIQKDIYLNFYGTATFILSNQAPFFIQLLILTLLFLPFYYMNLNQESGWNFLWLWFSLVFCGNAFGRFVSTDAQLLAFKYKFDQRSVFIFFNTIIFFTVGFVYAIQDMIWVIRWVAFINPLRYIFQIAILTEFHNRDEYIKNCQLPYDELQHCDPFKYFDFYEDTRWLNVTILIGVCVFLLICESILVNLYFKHRISKKKFNKTFQQIYCERSIEQLIYYSKNEIYVFDYFYHFTKFIQKKFQKKKTNNQTPQRETLQTNEILSLMQKSQISDSWFYQSEKAILSQNSITSHQNRHTKSTISPCVCQSRKIKTYLRDSLGDLSTQTQESVRSS